MDGDAETPRTLLSAVLRHNKPKQTIRRSPRRRSLNHNSAPAARDSASEPRLKKRRASKKLSSSTPSTTININSKPSDETPRSIINEILKKNNITKTLRVVIRQLHPTVFQKQQKSGQLDANGTKKDSVAENQKHFTAQDGLPTEATLLKKSQTGMEVEKQKTPSTCQKLLFSTPSNETPRSTINEILRKNNITKTLHVAIHRQQPTVSQSQQESEQRDADEAKQNSVAGSQEHSTALNGSLLQTETKDEESDLPSKAQPSSIQGPQNLKLRNKGMRLSNILSKIAEYPEPDSFSEDLLTKMDALVKNKNEEQKTTSQTTEIVTHRHGKMKISEPIMSSTRIHNRSSFNLSSSIIARKDVSTNTEAHYDENLDETKNHIPTSDVDDISSDSGPLELSRITEDEKPEPNSKDKMPPTSVNIAAAILEKDLSAETKQSSVEMAVVDENMQEIAEEPSEPTQDNDVSESMDDDIKTDISPHKLVSEEAPTTSKPTIAKKVRRRRVSNDLPISSHKLSGMIRHYSKRRFSSPALSAVEEASRLYFKKTAEHLEEICRSKQHGISKDDVEYLMKIRGTITKKKPLNVLIEENLPMEYREQLIPMAISGNVVLPRASSPS